MISGNNIHKNRSKTFEKNRVSLKVAVIYGFFSTLWILLSDQILLILVKDPEIMTRVQMVKGWAFILASTLIIFFILRREINQYLQIETAHQESEKNYREIFNAGSDAIIIHDADTGSIIDVNQTMLDMFGYTYQEALKLKINHINSDDSRFNPEAALERIRKASHEGPQLFEWLSKRKQGTCFWTEVVLRRTDIGGKKRVLALLRDISQRKERDNELRLMKHSIEHSSHPVFWILKNGRFLYANKASCHSLNYTSQELYKMTVSDIDPDFPAESWPVFWDRLKSEKTMTFESRHRKKNNDTFPVEITSSHLEFEGQEHVFAYVKDISDRVEYEKEQKRLQEQLQQTQKMEAIGTLAGGVAHDFNNILSGILGYSQMAQRHMDNPSKATEHINQVLKAAKRASKLTRQILTFSRKNEYKKYPINISHEVKDALKLLRSSIPSSIDIRQELDIESTVLADPIKVHQVIMNLCTNAYHAMEKTGGTLTVSLTEVKFQTPRYLKDNTIVPGQYVQLEIRDCGHGMDEKTLARAFDPYYTTKKPGQGTGLGLALVQAIVEDHDSYLEVDTSPGKGTRLKIYFPKIRNGEPYSMKASLAGKSFSGTECIMIVDDEQSILDAYTDLFTGFGYQACAFINGEEAFNAFNANPDKYDLIITDMTMPKLTGDLLIEKVRKLKPGIPIILSSGFRAPTAKPGTLESGTGYDLDPGRAIIPGIEKHDLDSPGEIPGHLPVKYIGKPVDSTDLLTLARAMLDQDKRCERK